MIRGQEATNPKIRWENVQYHIDKARVLGKCLCDKVAGQLVKIKLAVIKKKIVSRQNR